MKKRLYAISIVIIVTLLSLNAVAVKNCLQQHKGYDLINKRFRLIGAIKPQLADLENKLWGIISVYDPSQGRKVGLDELSHADIINKMMGNIDAVVTITKDDKMLIELDILKRSVRSLSKRIDAIKDRIDMKKMDEESAAMLFPETNQVYLLSESYVDEMKALLEQIRLVRKVIEGNICRYNEIGIQNFCSEDHAAAKINRRWLLIDVICVAGVLALTAALFGAIKQIKDNTP